MRCPRATTPGFNSREGLRPGEAEGTAPLRARGTLAPIPLRLQQLWVLLTAKSGAWLDFAWRSVGPSWPAAAAFLATWASARVSPASGHRGREAEVGEKGATVGPPLLLLVPSQGLVQ